MPTTFELIASGLVGLITLVILVYITVRWFQW